MCNWDESQEVYTNVESFNFKRKKLFFNNAKLRGDIEDVKNKIFWDFPRMFTISIFPFAGETLQIYRENLQLGNND